MKINLENRSSVFFTKAVIIGWVFLIGISLLFLLVDQISIAAYLSTYGTLIYFFFFFAGGIYLQRRQIKGSPGIFKGLKIIFFTWLIFVISFLLFFFLGFKLF